MTLIVPQVVWKLELDPTATLAEVIGALNHLGITVVSPKTKNQPPVGWKAIQEISVEDQARAMGQKLVSN